MAFERTVETGRAADGLRVVPVEILLGDRGDPRQHALVGAPETPGATLCGSALVKLRIGDYAAGLCIGEFHAHQYR